MSDKVPNNESVVLNHLLEVEQNAQALVFDAQNEADKRISSAKSSADAKFKEFFEKIIAENEQMYEKSIETIKSKSESAVKEFKERILRSEKTVDEFDSCLDKILFA